MIKYSEIKIGEKLKITGMGAPGFAQLGDIVTVEKVAKNRVDVVNTNGDKAFFALTCGAERLEKQK